MVGRLALVVMLALAVVAGGCGAADEEGDGSKGPAREAATAVGEDGGPGPAGDDARPRDDGDADGASGDAGEPAPDAQEPAMRERELSPEAARIAELVERGELADVVRQRVREAVREGQDPQEALERLRERYGDALAELRDARPAAQEPRPGSFWSNADGE